VAGNGGLRCEVRGREQCGDLKHANQNKHPAGMPGVHHRAAWLVCLGVTGLVSLLFLKRLVYRTEE